MPHTPTPSPCKPPPLSSDSTTYYSSFSHTTPPHLSMEERVPSIVHEPEFDPHNDNNHVDGSSPVTDTGLRSGTYVVQVPKDQVYRVPPPENAIIAARHRKPSDGKNKKKSVSSSRCCCFWCVLVIVIVVIIIVALLIGLAFIFFTKPKDPKFYVQNFVVKNSTTNKTKSHSHLTYNITLKIKNPNERTSISYEKGGDTSLFCAGEKLASGEYPTFSQSYQNSRVFDIALRGSTKTLPRQIEKSMKSKNSKEKISLSLSMNVPIKLKTWELKKENEKIAVDCSLTVDSLAKGTRVLSQECRINS